MSSLHSTVSLILLASKSASISRDLNSQVLKLPWPGEEDSSFYCCLESPPEQTLASLCPSLGYKMALPSASKFVVDIDIKIVMVFYTQTLTCALLEAF